MDDKIYTLDDTVIAQLAKLLQLAILSGTDIVDNMRLVRLRASEDQTLVLTDEYVESFEASLQTMTEELESEMASSESAAEA